MSDEILDVDILAFEQGDAAARSAVVDGVMQSLTNGFVYCDTDLSEDLLDEAYGMLAEFFSSDQADKDRYVVEGSHGQAGYTGLLVETAASSDVADWKEMLNWGPVVAPGHPLRTRFPHRFHDPVLPEEVIPGIAEVLSEFGDRVFDLQRRFLRIVATGLGAHIDFFDDVLAGAPVLNRAIRYPPMSTAPTPQGEATAPHVWAGAHADINLTTVLPRATTKGLQVEVGDGDDKRWIDAAPPEGHVIVNTGIMLERMSNGLVPSGWHRVVADADPVSGNSDEERYSVVQFCHPTPWTILSPIPSTVTLEHPARYAGIPASDLLDQVLYEINLVEGARRVD